MFYDVFSWLCSQNGKAETSVCRELGMSAANPKQWRNGKQPLPSTKKLLADYFGEDVSIFDSPIPEPPPLEEPKFIPVHVITSEESQLIHMYSKLTEKEKTAIFTLIEMLVK